MQMQRGPQGSVRFTHANAGRTARQHKVHPCACREDREDFDLKAAEGNTGKRGRPEGAAPGPGGAGGKRVFVNNLAEETTWQALKDYFKQAGPVAHADVLTVCPYVLSRSSSESPSCCPGLAGSLLLSLYMARGAHGTTSLALQAVKLHALSACHTEPPSAYGFMPSPQPAYASDQGGVLSAMECWQHNADACVLLQHEDGTSKKCGIVEFSSVADARRAISMMSNTVSTLTFKRACTVCYG